MAGKLCIVPTPVGNMADMTPRAVEALRAAALVLAEDTRTSAVLMRHFGISTPMASHHKFNAHKSHDPIRDRSDAGETI
ncbi:MAG: 16S rRNA (cytidine(1402)-2'-O)-methyltransferase, partial [Muribaculaceae bacterium]|nr:16S rRNA (cytidine(1402)-2'-O)-methyltransferase [Muribaculaceae bacterium]